MRIKPWRCARYGASQAGSTDFPYVALYNDGAGAELLYLYGLINPGGASLLAINCLNKQGTVGSKVAQGVPIQPTAMALPGQVWSGHGAQFTQDSLLGGGSTSTNSIFSELPLAIVDPGWSFVCQSPTSSTNTVQVTFFWQVVHAEDIMGGPCPVCDRLILGSKPSPSP